MIKESLLVHIWQRQLIVSQGLTTAGGQRATIIYPGRINRDAGPDFKDAVISLDEAPPLRGDVEVHVRVQDWLAHGHHRDAGYNRVILHVVLGNDRLEQARTPLENGGQAPVLALSPHLTGPLEQVESAVLSGLDSSPRCPARQHASRSALDFALEQAGVARLRLKAAQLASRLTSMPAEEVIYRGLMRALGYSKNKQAFEKLAAMAPVSKLRRLIPGPQGLFLQVLLLGVAGLLPCQRKVLRGPRDVEAERVDRLWRGWKQQRSMKDAEWRFARVRPENYPPRRIAGASQLIMRHSNGFLPPILEAMDQSTEQAICHALAAMFTVPGSGYWRYHYDFGLRCPGGKGLVGEGRAREIVVNAALPFLLAWAMRSGQPGLEERTVEVFLAHPPLEENWITFHMAAEIGTVKPVSNACRQQGLIHLYERSCRDRRCKDCLLGGL